MEMMGEIKLIAVDYQERRLDFFKEQLAAARRRLDWSVKNNADWIDHCEKGEVVSYYEWAVKMAERERSTDIGWLDAVAGAAEEGDNEMNETSPMQLRPLVDVPCKLGKSGCFEDGRCHFLGDCKSKIMTNGDKIRAMSDNELAKVMSNPCLGCIVKNCRLHNYGSGGCTKAFLKWLQQPAEDEIK